MGLMRTNQVSGDEDGFLDWGQALLQSAAPQQSKSLKCPRCGSMNTKFCYYNNYNRSQPRHLCKSCKRHWTKGGTLRNVPVGGGGKNKRPRVSASKIPTTSAAPCPNFSLSKNTSSDQKFGASSISFYRTLIRPPTPSITDNNIAGGSRIGLIDEDRNPSIEFHLSTGSMATFYEPLNAYKCSYAANMDSMTMDPRSSGSGGGLEPSSPVLELPSYCNWSEIEALTSVEVNVIGEDDEDDAKMKP